MCVLPSPIAPTMSGCVFFFFVSFFVVGELGMAFGRVSGCGFFDIEYTKFAAKTTQRQNARERHLKATDVMAASVCCRPKRVRYIVFCIYLFTKNRTKRRTPNAMRRYSDRSEKESQMPVTLHCTCLSITFANQASI